MTGVVLLLGGEAFGQFQQALPEILEGERFV